MGKITREKRLDRVKSIRGYLMIYLPEHHRADSQGYTKQHTVVREESRGRLLPDGWAIHHKNGDISDNRCDNLRAFSTSDHSTFHNFARRKAGVGLKACPKNKLEVYLAEWENRTLSDEAIDRMKDALMSWCEDQWEKRKI